MLGPVYCLSHQVWMLHSAAKVHLELSSFSSPTSHWHSTPNCTVSNSHASAVISLFFSICWLVHRNKYSLNTYSVPGMGVTPVNKTGKTPDLMRYTCQLGRQPTNNTTTATNYHPNNFKNKVELNSMIHGEMPENPVEEAIGRGGQEAGCSSEEWNLGRDWTEGCDGAPHGRQGWSETSVERVQTAPRFGF